MVTKAPAPPRSTFGQAVAAMFVALILAVALPRCGSAEQTAPSQPTPSHSGETITVTVWTEAINAKAAQAGPRAPVVVVTLTAKNGVVSPLQPNTGLNIGPFEAVGSYTETFAINRGLKGELALIALRPKDRSDVKLLCTMVENGGEMSRGDTSRHKDMGEADPDNTRRVKCTRPYRP